MAADEVLLDSPAPRPAYQKARTRPSRWCPSHWLFPPEVDVILGCVPFACAVWIVCAQAMGLFWVGQGSPGNSGSRTRCPSSRWR